MEEVFGSHSFVMAFVFGGGMLIAAYLHLCRMEGLRCSKLLAATKTNYPPAAVILPLKGIDPGLRENLMSVLSQDHPDLQFVFAFESADDPAYAVVEELVREAEDVHPGLSLQMVVAGISQQCSQKITNQLAALAQIEDRVEHLVFLDSDARPNEKFVRHLVAPLSDETIGATTGYRWYHPDKAGFSGMLCSTWNAGAFQAIVDPLLSFAWGGAMAISRDSFNKSGVEQAWQNSVTDDLSLTRAIKQYGLKIRFVPECVPITYEQPRFFETLEFTSRQMLIARIYHPAVWWVASIIHPLIIGFIFYGTVHLGLWLWSGQSEWLTGVGALALLPFFLASTYWLVVSGRDWMPEIAPVIYQRRWFYVLMAPFASLLSCHNTVRNLLTRKISWRGIDYELVSSQKTVVTRPENVTQTGNIRASE